jgi:hypothetical protein
MARPRKDIDPEKVEALAGMGLSGEEIGAVLGCSRDLLYKRFSTVIKSGHEKRNASIRRAQFEAGVRKGNVTMLIWLGKQFLGQRDKQELTGGGGGPLTVELIDDILAEYDRASKSKS